MTTTTTTTKRTRTEWRLYRLGTPTEHGQTSTRVGGAWPSFAPLKAYAERYVAGHVCEARRMRISGHGDDRTEQVVRRHTFRTMPRRGLLSESESERLRDLLADRPPMTKAEGDAVMARFERTDDIEDWSL